MTMSGRNIGLFALMALLLMSVGFIQSWDVSLTLLNLCIISAIMALGVNIQWGYAGLFNVGTMGFAALGGLARVRPRRSGNAGGQPAKLIGLRAGGACA